MKSILLPTIDYPPKQGGVARYLGGIAKTFPDEIEVLYWQGPISRIEMYRELASAAAQKKMILISHVLPIGTVALAHKLLRGIPYTIILHGMDFDLARRNVWKRFLTRRVLRGAAHIITNSGGLAMEVRRFVRIKHPIIVHPCVDDRFIDAAEHPRTYHEDERVRMLTVARLVRRKGHERVFIAMQKIRNLEYHIVGAGAYRGILEKRVKELGLFGRVHFRGEVPDGELTKIYRVTDIFVMPTTTTALDREGFGTVYIEAQTFGIPVIASNIAGVNEAVRHNRTGILVNDDEELVAALKKLAVSAELRKEMGRRGKEFVRINFTRDAQGKKLAPLIHKYAK
jgi:phosphatidyl-myo-inositol dimannoside synthase